MLKIWGAHCPQEADLQARLILKQVRQIQTHIHQIEQEIEEQSTFNGTAERLMAVPGLGNVGV